MVILMSYNRGYVNLTVTICAICPAKNVLQFTMVNYGKSIVNHSKS